MPPANYTASPTATQAPGPQPSADGLPISSLPVDGDPLIADSVAQALKEPIDWAAFNAARLVGSLFGTGADGSATITTGHPMTRDTDYLNLTIGATGILFTNSCVLRVKGTLTVISGAQILDFNLSSKNGHDQTLNTGIAAGGLGTNFLTGNSSILGGASGGASGSLSGAGVAGDPVVNSMGGAGGAGGASSSSLFAGGAAGAWSPLLNPTVPATLIQAIMMQGWFALRGGSSSARTGSLVGIQGGSGGGGGGSSNVDYGSGGAAGGGFILVLAQKIVFATSGDIRAVGGNGGALIDTGPVAYGGTGGGGGGGGILIGYGAKSGPDQDPSICCAGGSGGSSAGSGGFVFQGAAGSQGNVCQIPLGY